LRTVNVVMRALSFDPHESAPNARASMISRPPRCAPHPAGRNLALDPAAGHEKCGTREHDEKNENLDSRWEAGGAPTRKLAPRTRADEDL
jgi:hypothetical protein